MRCVIRHSALLRGSVFIIIGVALVIMYLFIFYIQY